VAGKIDIVPLRGLPAIRPGDDLAAFIVRALRRRRLRLREDDVLVVCQKVVSKAEGRVVRLGDVRPGARARAFAERYGKDPAVVELALREAREVLRMCDGHLITATGAGWVCANSGIDRSNQNAADEVTLLPLDADASARRLRRRIRLLTGVAPAVVISDTFGRPWRLGQVDVAIGVAGMVALESWQGRRDWAGRRLEHTELAVADQVAAAAGLVAGKDAGVPAVLVRGLQPRRGRGGAAALVRPRAEDLFR